MRFGAGGHAYVTSFRGKLRRVGLMRESLGASESWRLPCANKYSELAGADNKRENWFYGLRVRAEPRL